MFFLIVTNQGSWCPRSASSGTATPQTRSGPTIYQTLTKGALYLAIHPHGTHAWGRWVGMSYDGEVMTGWGAIARTEEDAAKIVQDLIDSKESR
jgi:hypothetical protein